MEFDLSKPQKLLRETARDFFARDCPMKRVREVMAMLTALDEHLWSQIADQGWIGLHVDERSGGLGLSSVELAVVSEEMGRACLPGPFLACTWAATLLAELGGKQLAAQYLEPLASGKIKATVALLEPSASWNLDDVSLPAEETTRGLQLTGRKILVPDAAVADVIICPVRHRDELVLAAIKPDTMGLTITPTPGIDETRKVCELELNAVTVQAADVLATGERARSALARSMQVASVAVCADMLGGMQWILESTVQYAKTRQQFGRVIGSFQAVQHQCADMLLMTESARSATYFAAWALSTGAPEMSRAVATAKAYVSDCAREVANRGVQIHGGIGFTWEHDLHLYYKRAKASETLLGDATHHRDEIARAVIDALATV